VLLSLVHGQKREMGDPFWREFYEQLKALGAISRLVRREYCAQWPIGRCLLTGDQNGLFGRNGQASSNTSAKYCSNRTSSRRGNGDKTGARLIRRVEKGLQSIPFA